MSMFQSMQRRITEDQLSGFAPLAALMLTLTFAGAAWGQNIINTVAGGGPINSNPVVADIPGPTAVVEDAAGDKYVAAPISDYVFKLTTSGVVQPFAGLGWGHYNKTGGGTSGPASQIPLYAPTGLAMDTKGDMYIADTVNNVIRELYLSSGVWDIMTVAGQRHICNQQNEPTCDDGSKPTKAYLANPQGVVVDTSGNIYIADTGDNVIRVVNAARTAISLFAGNYNGDNPCPDSTQSCGDGGPATAAGALLNGPTGVALDSQNDLYIADTYDNRIRCVAAVAGGCVSGSTPGYIYTVAGTGSPCTIYNYESPFNCGDGGSATEAWIGRPAAVSVSASGTIYVTDTRASLIRIISGGIINTFAGTPGQRGYSGDGGAATAALLMGPSGVYADGAGNVLIADTGNQRIREVTGGVINTILGGGNGGDGAGATSAVLANPYQVAVDAANNYYIADAANNRIRVVNTQTSSITIATVSIPAGGIATIAGTGNVGYSGDGGAATLATLNSPEGLAVDAAGDIFISDTYNGWVREVDGATGIITTLSATSPVTLPAALAIDKLGNLFIADPPAQVIWELGNGVIAQVAGTGSPGYSGDGGPATSAQLDQPTGVAVDANENLYIADSNNNVIRCVAFNAGGCGNAGNQAGYIVTYAYNGGFDYEGDGGPATQASRWGAMEVAVDVRGNLFIGGGAQAATVQRVDAASGTIITVAGVENQLTFGFSGDGGPATKADLNNMGLVLDSNENLLIAENGSNRIREVPLVAQAKFSPSSLVFGSQTVGTSSPPQTVTLTNIGSDDLLNISITITGGDAGDFKQNNNCPAPPAGLAPRLSSPQTCNINVTFTPTEKGTRKALLTFTDSGYKSPQSVSLSGTGE